MTCNVARKIPCRTAFDHGWWIAVDRPTAEKGETPTLTPSPTKMPRRMKNSKHSHSRKSHSAMGVNEDKPVRFMGRFYSTLTSATNTFVLGLNPLQFDARCITVSDAFQEYRFTKVHLHAWLGNIIAASPSVTPGGANLALAYEPGILSSFPVSVQECQNLQNVKIGNGTYGVPYPSLRLSGAALTGPSPVKWFRRGTAFDDTLELQGLIVCASTDTWNARPLTLFVEYEIEFRAPADTVLTSELKADPTPAELQDQLTELQRVLGVAPRLKNTLKLPAPLKVDDGYVDAASDAVGAGAAGTNLAGQGRPSAVSPALSKASTPLVRR